MAKKLKETSIRDKCLEVFSEKLSLKRILILGLILRLLLSFGVYHPDLGNHLDWGRKFWEIGPAKFYENQFWQVSWPNQPPGTIYIFAAVRKIYEGIFGLAWQLNLKIPAFPSRLIPFLESSLYPSLVKLPSILADLGIGVLIYKFLQGYKKGKLALLGAVFFLFNPIVIYNSAVWGQTDALVNFFALWAVYLFFRKKPFWGTFMFICSFYFKASLVILFPLIFLLLWRSELPIYKKILALMIPPILLAYLSYPFVRWMSPVPWLYHLYLDRIFGHQGNMLTGNAFNLWALFFGIDFSKNDQGVFLGLTYKVWGAILFTISYLVIIVNLLQHKYSKRSLVLSLVLVAYSSFLFMTNMHERYLFPIFPYLAILIGLEIIPLRLYFIISLLHFSNLYNLWFYPPVGWFKELLIWQNGLITRFFSVTLILVFFWLGKYYFSLKNDKID